MDSPRTDPWQAAARVGWDMGHTEGEGSSGILRCLRAVGAMDTGHLARPSEKGGKAEVAPFSTWAPPAPAPGNGGLLGGL